MAQRQDPRSPVQRNFSIEQLGPLSLEPAAAIHEVDVFVFIRIGYTLLIVAELVMSTTVPLTEVPRSCLLKKSEHTIGHPDKSATSRGGSARTLAEANLR